MELKDFLKLNKNEKGTLNVIIEDRYKGSGNYSISRFYKTDTSEIINKLKLRNWCVEDCNVVSFVFENNCLKIFTESNPKKD